MTTKICTKCKLPKLLSEFTKDNSRKDGLRSNCIICLKQYREINKEYLNNRANIRYQTNKDSIKKHYHLNNEKRKAYQREYQTTNKKQVKAYQQENPDARNAANAKRRATKLNATPKWVEIDLIKQLYSDCKDITETTGIIHHVDHIVPLHSELVCGLHCIANLQILTAIENMTKHNSYWPDMP